MNSMMERGLYALAALATLALAAPAFADPIDGDPISTASPTVFPAQTITRDPLLIGYDDPYGAVAEPVLRDGKLHGMVQVGVGTGGYRQAAVAVSGPLGQNGYFAIAVEDAQYGQGRARKMQQPAPAPAAP